MKFNRLRGRKLIGNILLCSGLSFLLFGYDQGLFGGILSGQDLQEVLGNPSSTMSGLVTAVYDIGCALGAVAAFIWGEWLGRKRSLILANIIVIIGAAIQTASYSYAQMFVGRIIGGVGVGLSTVAVPILQSETLPAKTRGSLLVIQSALIIIGVAVASWLCFATLFANSSFQWRFPVACQIIFALSVLAFCPFLPDTPRWLVKQGRDDEARETLARLLDKGIDDQEVQAIYGEIADALEEENRAGPTSWSEVFSNRTKARNLQRVVIGSLPYMMNQWSGVNALSYYMAYILEVYLDFSQNMALILASVAFTQYAVFSWPPMFYIDKIGRRWTIIGSSAGCCVCMFLIGGLLQRQNSEACVAGAVAFMFLFLDFFTLGILCVSWSYSSEIQPLRVRGKATAVGVFCHWMSNFVVVMVTPIGLDSIAGSYFFIWAVINASFVPISYFLFVETAGRSLERIDRLFYDHPTWLIGLNKEAANVERLTEEQRDTERQEFAAHALARRVSREKKDGTEKVTIEERNNVNA